MKQRGPAGHVNTQNYLPSPLPVPICIEEELFEREFARYPERIHELVLTAILEADRQFGTADVASDHLFFNFWRKPKVRSRKKKALALLARTCETPEHDEAWIQISQL